MVKLLENTFRSVNIGLVNEMALMCEKLGIDVWEVVDAAKTKPFGFMPFYPGPGLGGHCIPIDPLLSVVEGEADRLRAAADRAGRPDQRRDAARRRRQDQRWRSTTTRSRSTDRAVLVAGVTYKRDIDDIRESPALDIMGLLHQRGAHRQLCRSVRPDARAARDWGGDQDLVSAAARGGDVQERRLRRDPHGSFGFRQGSAGRTRRR